MGKVYLLAPVDEEDFGDTIILPTNNLRVFDCFSKALRNARHAIMEGDPDVKSDDISVTCCTDELIGYNMYWRVVEHECDSQIIEWFYIIEMEVE